MPGEIGSFEAKKMTPAAGKRGGKAQTKEEEKEKQEESKATAERLKKKHEARILNPKQEVLDEANQVQRGKIEQFLKKAKEKLINNWSADELKDAVKEMFTLGAELHGEGADEELRNLVGEYEYILADELYEKLEKTGQGDEALRFYRELLKGTPREYHGEESFVLEEKQGRQYRVPPEQAKELWKEYYKQQGKDIATLPSDERQTLELIIAQGIAPEYHREPKQVLAHARIQDDRERIVKVMKILNIEELTPKQKKAFIWAHNVGRGELGKDGKPAGIYNYTQEQTAEKTRILAEAFTPWQRRKILQSALAGDPIPVADITDPQLALQARLANRMLEDVPDENLHEQAQLLQQLQNNLSSVISVDQGQREQLLDRITDRLIELKRQIRPEERRREAEREERGRRLGRNEISKEETYLKRDTVEGFNLERDTYTGRVREIADRLNNDFPTATTPSTIDNDRLKSDIDVLSLIAGGADEQATQAQKLLTKLNKLKEDLRAQMDTELLRMNPGLYGEIRMDPDKQKTLIQNILEADPDAKEGKGWEKWQEVEKEFNLLFRYADIDSNHEWRDAIGPGGDMEIRDFQTLLKRAGDNETLPLGKSLTPDEQKKVQRVGRMLNQEQTVREYLHTITYYVNKNFSAEEMIKVASRFAGEEAQVAFQKRGVAQMMRMYEQAMLEVVARNGGYLPAKAMINNTDGTYGEVEQLVLDMATKAKAMKVLPEDMEDWEIKRAISLGRGMGIITARFFEIAAMHGISKNIPLNSWWANGLIKNIAFFEQVIRFDVGQKQNAILGYKLEGNSGPWSTDELKKYKAMSQQEIFDILVNDHDDDRLGQKKNPFHIGSIFTQTLWRWKGDPVNLASATARLLQYDKDNPLIGVGLLIEAKRGDLAGSDKNKAQEAEQVIRNAIGIAEKTTPLKFFNNLISLRQDVLRKYYKDQIKEAPDFPGQIIIQSKELQNDLSALALVQEELLGRRVKQYKEFLEQKKTNPELPSPTLDTNLNFEILREGGDPGQANRVTLLAKHIQDEFASSIGGKSHKEKLMFNLKDKGWKVPWVFGTDDIPHEAFDYAAITGNTIQRRWESDIGPVVATAGLYGKFIQNLSEFKSQGDIVKAMKEIHNTLSSHDASVANDVMRDLAEGVGKFYKKDWVTRLPLGIGKIEGFVGGKASYAQVAMGRGQMAWDELDMQAFIQHVYASGLVDEEQKEKLKKRLGAETYQLAWAMARSGIPMLFLSFIYMMLNEQLEQLKKAS